MKKKSLSVKKKKHKLILDHLKDKKINKIYKNFQNFLDLNIKKKTSFAVGVSGGPDSLALSFLIKSYSLLNDREVKFYIVDHKLRKNSSNEATSIKVLLKKFDISCVILKWRGKKPKSNIQGIARYNRYKLLKKACKKNKIENLLLGHHNDDLHENFFIRLLRGSGLKGLSSFGEVVSKEENNIFILRPLIKIQKKDLIYLSKKVFGFYVQDPSNHNLFFKRSRVRNFINELKNEGFDKKKLNLTINNLQSANNAINFYVSKNVKNNSKYIEYKNTYIVNKFFFNQPEEVIFRSISMILKLISKKYYAPRGKSILDLVLKIRSGKVNKLTLGGCYIEKYNETVLISSEN